MFHANDGLTFERAANGHVIIMVRDIPDWQEIDIDPDTWTSAVAAVAYLPMAETEALAKAVMDNIHLAPENVKRPNMVEGG